MEVFENSKWIWIGKEQVKDEYGEFFSFFSCTKNKTLCRISCDGDYTLFINGKFAASNQYGDFEHYKVYDEIDITELLNDGENSFAVLVWHVGEDFQRYKNAQAGVIFEVIQSDKMLLLSDERILCRKSKTYLSGYEKKITSQLGFSFLYDATKEDCWTVSGNEDFKPVVRVEKVCSFYLRPIKKLQLAERKKITILKNDENYYLIDLGEESVGVFTFEFVSKTEQKILVAWGEDLQSGRVRRIIGDRDFSFEYVAKNGKNVYTNYMLRIGGRYLELYANEPIEFIYAGVLPQFYPVKEKVFTTADETEKRIYDVCVKTLELCMMEHYADTPWREQCLYAFDARNQMLCGYYAFEGGNFEYARSNLKLMAKDERQDGLLSICYPCGADLTIPSFSLYYFMAVREYLDYSGDVTFAKEVFPKLNSVIKTFIENRKNGLVCKFEGKNHWNFYDWSEFLEGNLFKSDISEPDLVINCLFISALENLRKIAEKADEPFLFYEIAEQTKIKVKDAFFDKKRGAFSLTKNGKDFTVLGNSFAVSLGLCDNPQELCEKIINGEFSECSLSMKCFKYDALIKTDIKKYKNLVLAEIKKDYKKMLDCGATSVWETADGAEAFDNAGSLCHGWNAMPVYYYRVLSDL